jgi:hypothetical protein
MDFLTKLEKVAKLKRKEIQFAGLDITIQEMDGDMNDYFNNDGQKRFKYKGKGKNIEAIPESYDHLGHAAMVVAMGLIDGETGNLVFDYKKRKDIEKINSYSPEFRDFLKDEILELSGQTEEAKLEAEKKSPQAEESESGSE